MYSNLRPVSIPERGLESLRPLSIAIVGATYFVVSIPERGLESLRLSRALPVSSLMPFQSLRGVWSRCGINICELLKFCEFQSLRGVWSRCGLTSMMS